MGTHPRSLSKSHEDGCRRQTADSIYLPAVALTIAEPMLKDAIQTFLLTRTVKVGETVQCGWLAFRVVEVGPPAVLESLDFVRMASFTTDLSRADSIYTAQQAMLNSHGVAEELCTVRHTAIVSKSYRPRHPGAFLKRDTEVEGHSSGWYVGVANDPLSIEDQSTFELRSLYELSISDERMIPYWLLPVGATVYLTDGTLEWETGAK